MWHWHPDITDVCLWALIINIKRLNNYIERKSANAPHLYFSNMCINQNDLVCWHVTWPCVLRNVFKESQYFSISKLNTVFLVNVGRKHDVTPQSNKFLSKTCQQNQYIRLIKMFIPSLVCGNFTQHRRYSSNKWQKATLKKRDVE